MHFAAEENEEAALVEQISRGCDIDAVDERGNTPLHLACRHCHVNIAKELLPCMVTVPSLAVPSGHRLSGSLGSLSGTPAALLAGSRR